MLSSTGLEMIARTTGLHSDGFKGLDGDPRVSNGHIVKNDVTVGGSDQLIGRQMEINNPAHGFANVDITKLVAVQDGNCMRITCHEKDPEVQKVVTKTQISSLVVGCQVVNCGPTLSAILVHHH